MKLSDIIPSDHQLKFITGIERILLQRKRTQNLSGILAIVLGISQVLIASVNEDYVKNLGQFFNNLVNLRLTQLVGPDGLPIPELTGILVLAGSIGVYLLLKRTDFLLKESKEPFRYTFCVEPFTHIEEATDGGFVLRNKEQLKLLHHDLVERLNDRIRRLSFLNLPSDVQEDDAPTSHIHISGQYVIRQDHDGNWLIHVTPRIRIGPTNRAEALADPVKYPLNARSIRRTKGSASTPDLYSYSLKEQKSQNPRNTNIVTDSIWTDTLDASRYYQLIERVYSRISTEIYKQIFTDVNEKLEMFPTRYLRAVALYHEAKDFERSNTVDAYDYAVEFYRHSRHNFDKRIFRSISKFMLTIPLLWHFSASSQIMEARARIGYCRCLIYRRSITALSGRSQNTLFEIPDEIKEKTINKLITLYNHVSSKKWKIKHTRIKHTILSQHDDNRTEKVQQYNTLMAFLTSRKSFFLQHDRYPFKRIAESLFDAYTVGSLAYSWLGSKEIAEQFLNNAKAVDPALSQESALWFLAACEIESDVHQKLILLRKATEIAPNFEFAQYRLAQYSEMRLRLQNEIREERVMSVINEYDEVRRMNPGNIAALSAQGYLWWLLKRPKYLEIANKKFEEGLEIKANTKQTFIGDLIYGLARIEAEEDKGDLHKSYDLFMQAISADPGVAACTVVSQAVTSAYFDFMPRDMLARYKEYKNKVQKRIEEFLKDQRKPVDKISKRILDSLYSFALNDYGNANLNYYLRFGNHKMLDDAIDAYRLAIEKYPENPIVYYNLYIAYIQRLESLDKMSDLLSKAEEAASTWQVGLIASVKIHVEYIQQKINELDNKLKELEEDEKVEREENEKHKSIKSRVQQSIRKLEDEKVEREENEKHKSINSPIQQSIGYTYQNENERFGGTADTNNEIARIKHKIDEVKEQKGKVDLELALKNQFEKLGKIMKQSKFISFYEQLEISYDGKGVNEFLANKDKIDKGNLDENDLEALKTWAELLSNNTNKPSALESCERLCFYILENYYPKDLDICITLNKIYRISKLGTNSQIPDMQKKCKQAIRSIIENWLDDDPIMFLNLKWATEIFSEFFFIDERIRFLEKAIKLESNNDIYHYMLGKVYYENREIAKAINAYKEAVQIDPKNDEYSKSLKNILMDEGQTYFYNGNYVEAIEKYKEVLRIDSEDSRAESRLDEARIALCYGEDSPNFVPAVTPIIVKVDNNLVPCITKKDQETGKSVLDPMFEKEDTRMRNEIREMMGVRVPGIRYRGNDARNGAVRIMINEVPVSTVLIPEDKRLFVGTAEDLSKLGIHGEETINPQTDDRAFWILKKDWDKIETASLSIWQVREYILRYIERVLREHFMEFFGHYEVMDKLKTERPDLFEKLRENPANVNDLTIVFRSLLAEQVKITAFDEIVEKFISMKEKGADIMAIIGSIRLIPEIRTKLAGNEAKYSFYLLGDWLERELEGSITKSGLRPVLAIEQGKHRNINRLIEGELEARIASQRNIAVLVENEEIRPFVRKLIEDKFPHVPVLSSKELLTILKSKIKGKLLEE